MAVPLEEWHNELVSVDNPENFLKIVSEVEETYLESEAANDRKRRIKTLWFLRHLKKMF